MDATSCATILARPVLSVGDWGEDPTLQLTVGPQITILRCHAEEALSMPNPSANRASPT